MSSISRPELQENQILILDETTGDFRSVIVEEESSDVISKPPNVRKRKARPDKWKRNVRHKLHQAGKEYESVKGKVVQARTVKTTTDCVSACKFGCGKTIEDSDRLLVFQKYYDMTQNEKYHFILETTERLSKKRCTNNTNKRKFSFIFHSPIKGNNIRVCKSFYLGTLDISQKVVYGTHNRKDTQTGTPAKDGRGKHNKQKTYVSEERKRFLREHIASFPHVDSHYCRSSTTRKYLEPSLNISKMYDLYLESCEEKQIQPLKKTTYHKVFMQEFNLSFLKPKKDLCDLCSQWKMAKKEGIMTTELDEKYQNHLQEKEAMRLERKQDKNTEASNVLCFDLQNVINCPKAEVSCFFYHSKINVYNLTGHFSKTKQVYCVLWVEITSGRSGNDLASAFRKLIEAVYNDNKDITEITLWSDSCVPQNRNSMISYAVLDFLKCHPNITKVHNMKYCTPGHSAIQEVDAAHSTLDRVLSVADFYSPLSLIKIMLKANKKNPYKIIQMTPTDFKNFGECAKQFKYENVPFCSITSIVFTQEYFKISYCLSHAKKQYITVNILPNLDRPRRDKRGQPILLSFPRNLPEPKILKNDKKLPENKIKSIKAMLKFMPLLDKDYYKAVLKL